MSPAGVETYDAYVVYQSGLLERLKLLKVPTGWRVGSVPLGSDTLAFGDYVSVEKDRAGEMRINQVRGGGWRTIRSNTPIPPSEALVVEMATRGFIAAWNADGWLSICVPINVVAEAQQFIARWEAQMSVARLEKGLGA